MKRLLTTLTHKWPEYLLEILVLIIGIYGAFALESWKENRKEQEEILNYIQSIKKDIEADHTLFKQISQTLNEQISAGAYIIPILESKHPVIDDSLKFILNFNDLTGGPIISQQTNTWDYVNSSGVISKINDQQLTDQLQFYYREYDFLVENFNQSAVPPRLEIRRLKYELMEDKELKKFFPTTHPIAPSPEVYQNIFDDKRILPLCRFIGSGSAIYFEGEFQKINDYCLELLQYLESTYPQ